MMQMRAMRVALSLLFLCPALALAASSKEDRLTRPIAPDLADRWIEGDGPVRVHGSTWLIGFTHMNIVLIATKQGLVLIDAGLPQSAPLVEEHLARAGFNILDVKLILSSEPHFDHAGGIAALARDSGAKVLAGRAAIPILRVGRSGDEDPQNHTLVAYPGVTNVIGVDDGQTIQLGDLLITAHATPGHTPGSISWSWQSCETGGDCMDVVFAASLNSLTDGHYRYSDPVHGDTVANFRHSFETIRHLPCDILITGHPEHSDGDVRLMRLRAGEARGYRSPGACRVLADRYERAFDDRLAEERRAADHP